MTWRHLKTDEYGVKTEIKLGRPGKLRELLVRVTMPPSFVNPILDANHELGADANIRAYLRNTQSHRVRIASIPIPVYRRLLREFGRDEKKWKAWLNDSENRGWRVVQCHV